MCLTQKIKKHKNVRCFNIAIIITCTVKINAVYTVQWNSYFASVPSCKCRVVMWRLLLWWTVQFLSHVGDPSCQCSFQYHSVTEVVMMRSTVRWVAKKNAGKNEDFSRHATFSAILGSTVFTVISWETSGCCEIFLNVCPLEFKGFHPLYLSHRCLLCVCCFILLFT